MRWLLLKDLQILRRSPFLVVMLIAYPVIISVLIGLALSRGPDKPKVAIVNELPAGQTSFSVGSQHLDVAQYAKELFKSVDPVTVDTRAEAVAKVRSGEVLGALIVPADATKKLQDAINLAGTTDLNSSLANCATSRRRPPTEKLVSPAGSSLTIATFGLSGPRDSASPMRTEMTSG